MGKVCLTVIGYFRPILKRLLACALNCRTATSLGKGERYSLVQGDNRERKMRAIEIDLDDRVTQRVPSPGRCIYCPEAHTKLTDEHVIPYALAAHTLILEKSCCIDCQGIIQRYEQEVLRKQLGNFRTQVDAPTRDKKGRQTELTLRFVEVNSKGEKVRDLGSRALPHSEAPIALNLWSSPPPRLLRDLNLTIDESGRPWTFVEMEVASKLCRMVASEEGVEHVALKLGEVNRHHFLRWLAKTAHAYAVTVLGPDAFEPWLLDVILNRSDDVAQFVGDVADPSPFPPHPAHTFQISLGKAREGPADGCVVVRIQLYPMLNSPSHIVVVGRAVEGNRSHFPAAD